MAREAFDGSDLNPGAMDELTRVPDGQPFALVNLLLYKEWAQYPPGMVTEKLTGAQAYERYAELSIPFVNEVGGVPMWRGMLSANLIGPTDDRQSRLLGHRVSPHCRRKGFTPLRSNFAGIHRSYEMEAVQTVAKNTRPLNGRLANQTARSKDEA